MDIDFEIMREKGFFQRVHKDRYLDIKKVEKNGGWKDVTHCPICSRPKIGPPIYETTIVNSFICPVCDCLFNDKKPTNLNTGYYNLNSEEDLKTLPDKPKFDYRKERFGKERLQLISLYLRKPMKEASLLDFGCGTGFFLDVSKDSFKEVSGLEDSKVLVDVLRRDMKVKIYTNLSEIKEKFDVIALFDLIEHMENPVDFLDSLFDYLNDDGIIVVFTPNHRSPSFEILGTENNQYFPSDHLQFFSIKTLKYVADKFEERYRLEMYQTSGMDFFDLLAYDRDIRKVNIRESILLKHVNTFQKIIDSCGRANHLRFILRKVK